MDWKLFVQLAVTVLVALTGGWLGHRLSARRDLINERRKLKITYLVEAYRQLEDALHRDDPERSHPKWESAIADVQLLGSPKQVHLARTFALEMAADHTASLSDLINDMRRSLREELHLPPVRDTVVHLRFKNEGPQAFDQTLATTTNDVKEAKVEGAANVSPAARELLEQGVHFAGHIGNIVIAWNELEALVRKRLVAAGFQETKLGAAPLLDFALKQGVITDVQRRSLRGLNAMRNLAVHGQREVGKAEVEEFLALAEAMRTVLEIT